MSLCKIPNEWDIRKVAVFDNAKRLFATFGFSNVTFEDIARGYKKDEKITSEGIRGVSKALARTFFTKEELLREIFRTAWANIQQVLKDIVKSSDQPSAKFRTILDIIPYLLEEDLDAVGVLIRERYPASGSPEDLAGCPEEMACLEILVKLVRTIEENKQLKINVGTPRTIVHCFYGAIEHAMLDIYLQYVRNTTHLRVKRIVDAHGCVEALVATLRAMTDGIVADDNKIESPARDRSKQHRKD